MDKEKIKLIFNELLEAWEDSECTVIHDRGDLEDFEALRIEKEKYKIRFYEALDS